MLIISTGLYGCSGSDSETEVVPPEESSPPPPAPPPDPPPSPAPTSSRLKNIEYDFDNNGVFEGLLTLEYDDSGRIAGAIYTYTDDGTEDAKFESFSLASFTPGDESTEHEEFYEVDDENRVTEYRIVSEGGNPVSVFAASYSADFILDSADTSFSNTGISPAIVLNLSTSFDYTSGRLDGWEQTDNADGTVFDSLSFTYLADGRLGSMLNGDGDITELSWTGENRIAKQETTSDDGEFLGMVEYRYEEGLLVQEAHEIIPLPGRTFTRYDFIYTYDDTDRIAQQNVDLGADGSIEAVVLFEMEEAPCVQMVFWINNLIDPFLAFDAEKSLLMPASGWGLPRSCHIEQ
uniref:hypothetical protein n=1 Tax=Ningiella ruwaisensis TaxID=2364274 RepID=UPI0014456B45|nr:hypothetical protein [Ningiella ruwaisensis]